MSFEICELDIDNKPYSFEVQGDFDWGDPINTFIIENNVIRGFISFDQFQEIIDNLRKKK